MKYFPFIFVLLYGFQLLAQEGDYPWLEGHAGTSGLLYQLGLPQGYERVAVQPHSFGWWLRHLPLKAPGAPVMLHDGRPKGRQDVHWRVLDIDTGRRDLQQCADAVMRLRAEYLYACGQHGQIHFNFTSGDRADYSRWRQGYRPLIQGQQVQWRKTAAADDSYAGFRAYLNTVFAYAGTYSLSRELRPVADPGDLQPGDVFIQGGFPGHAVIVVDVARHRQTGKKIFVLAQSYMPAQDMHILHNPNNPQLSPWYEVPRDGLHTPEWYFEAGSLKRF